MKTLKNQNGFAVVVTVVVVTMAILTSITMTYIYSMNRLRYHARIKEAYKLINATESAAKIVKTIWDQRVAANPAGTSPGVIVGQVVPLIAALPVTTCPAGRIEVQDPDGGNAFCFNYVAGQQVNVTKMKSSPLEMFLAKLVYFYEGEKSSISLEKPTLVGWLFNEKKAAAATITFNVGAPGAPDCQGAPATPGCARCKDGNGATAKGACSIITICPFAWAECRAGGVGITQAIRISTGNSVLIDDY